MVEIRRILCPIDFSDFSRRALDHAVAIAGWYGADVTVLHVCAIAPAAAYAPGEPPLPSIVLTPADRAQLLASMQQFAASPQAPDVPLQCDLGEGSAAAEIVAKAAAMSCNLIVMGTHGRSGFDRLVLGSATEKVLRRAPCPVLSVPPALAGAVSPAPAQFTRVLCAVDFSDCSLRALDYAMSLAQEAGATLTVVHAIESLPEPPAGVHETVRGGPRSLLDYVAEAEQDARDRLRDAVPEAVREYCAVETLVARGKPYREVLRIAAERRSDLIVIGVHGRGPVDLLFFGSTAQQVVRHARCPVLTCALNP